MKRTKHLILSLRSGFSEGSVKALVFLIVISGLISACSTHKKLLGDWRLVSNDLTEANSETLDTAKSEQVAELHEYYKTNYHRPIGLVFRNDSIYEHYAARGVNLGEYNLKGRWLTLTKMFMGHKANQTYKINKVNKKELMLITDKSILKFVHPMDPEFEAAKLQEPVDLNGSWSNQKEREALDEPVVFKFIQTGPFLEGTVYLPSTYKKLKGAPRYEFEGEVAGNLAKIFVVKNVKGQAGYAAKSYELRLEYEYEHIQATFIRQRYLDAEGNLVEFLGDVDSPFPRKMILQ